MKRLFLALLPLLLCLLIKTTHSDPLVVRLDDQIHPMSGSWAFANNLTSVRGKPFDYHCWPDRGPATFDVSSFDRFQAYVGIADGRREFSSFRVDVDGQKAFETFVRSGQSPVFIDIPLTGHRTLSLYRLQFMGSSGGYFEPKLIQNEVAPPVVVSPPSPPVEQNNVFNWTDIPQNQSVSIVRASFDAGGYQIYDTQGETILVPFTDQNLYVMKFGLSYDGTMSFVNRDGATPILYLPPDGYLENATVSDGRWYPFSPGFHPSVPVYLGVAPNWDAYNEMGWYHGMFYRGGYWSHRAYSNGVALMATPGLVVEIGGARYEGWSGYHEYYRGHAGGFHPAYRDRNIYHRVEVQDRRSDWNRHHVDEHGPMHGNDIRHPDRQPDHGIVHREAPVPPRHEDVRRPDHLSPGHAQSPVPGVHEPVNAAARHDIETPGSATSHTTTSAPGSRVTSGSAVNGTTTSAPGSRVTSGSATNGTTTSAPGSRVTSGSATNGATTSTPGSRVTSGSAVNHTATSTGTTVIPPRTPIANQSNGGSSSQTSTPSRTFSGNTSSGARTSNIQSQPSGGGLSQSLSGMGGATGNRGGQSQSTAFSRTPASSPAAVSNVRTSAVQPAAKAPATSKTPGKGTNNNAGTTSATNH
ncbi:MAG: NPCBM/NEW2 domain-containing protein [Capsulimonadaceae bacterium]|nr:NPCBM/NEW2 domain-containing protein [Capsulimonadaceae bacterium]